MECTEFILNKEERASIKKSVTEWEIRDKKERDKKLTEIIVPRYNVHFSQKNLEKMEFERQKLRYYY